MLLFTGYKANKQSLFRPQANKTSKQATTKNTKIHTTINNKQKTWVLWFLGDALRKIREKWDSAQDYAIHVELWK